jgi:uncharacterized protein (DUF1330 family)
MATYLLASIDVKDVERYDRDYVPGVGPLIQKHGGRVLIATDKFDSRPAKGYSLSSTACNARGNIERIDKV